MGDPDAASYRGNASGGSGLGQRGWGLKPLSLRRLPRRAAESGTRWRVDGDQGRDDRRQASFTGGRNEWSHTDAPRASPAPTLIVVRGPATECRVLAEIPASGDRQLPDALSMRSMSANNDAIDSVGTRQEDR
jgi:hypothetical protein